MRDPALNTRTGVIADVITVPAVAEPRDVLSAPDVETMLPAALAMWPRGAAWGTPDGLMPRADTHLAGLTRALLAAFGWAYRRAWQLTREAVAASADETLERWEADHGLPDRCMAPPESRSERLARLRARVADGGTITPADFVGLALRAGFRVTIEEPATFECGFSECGGEHSCGHPNEETCWTVHVADLTISYFHAGEGEVGHDPLFSTTDLNNLRCALERVAPGWTRFFIRIED